MTSQYINIESKRAENIDWMVSIPEKQFVEFASYIAFKIISGELVGHDIKALTEDIATALNKRVQMKDLYGEPINATEN